MRSSRLTAETAEQIAINALAFIAADQGRLGQFLATTGYDPAQIRAEAGSAHFLTGVLDFLLSDESQLLVFASHSGLDPAQIGAARQALAGETDREL